MASHKKKVPVKKTARQKIGAPKSAPKKAAPKKGVIKSIHGISDMKLFGADFNMLEGHIPQGDIEAFNFVPIIGYAARFNPEMQRGFIRIKMDSGTKEFELDPAGMAATITMLKSFNCSYNGQYIGFNLL